ncbi:MAG: outer membrane beta-barrel protein [Bacteroidetes bacterium]|nr:outer membrane beta-barrel protein [Bacteroidota bacterium]
MNFASTRLSALRLLLFFTIVFLVPEAAAQSGKFDVRGTVVDSSATPLAGATVVVMQQADSVLVSYGVSKGDGTFRLRRVPTGSYIFQVTFVGFASHTGSVTVAAEDLDVGRITLSESVEELDELVISADHIPMLVTGDTLVYNANAFKTRPNANVEELLKRLPGIDVDRDGTIKAQGEQVNKVLVDGKEFFGNDPKIATKNLPADAVDKVQVYDKQSDMAEFTGIKDGDEEKTINLELKEDRKTGYFGDVTAGLGNSDIGLPMSFQSQYDTKLNVNRFSPTTQFSLIGNLNNINRQGFAFNDFLGFMGGMGALMSGDFQMDSGVQLGSDISDGFSTTTSGGINFNRDFGSRTEFGSSYFISHIDNTQDRSVLQQQLIGSAASTLVSQNSNQGSNNLSHRLNLNGKHKFSDGHDLRLRGNLNLGMSKIDNASLRQSLGADGLLENASNTDYNADGHNLGGDGRLTWRKRLSESGRSVVAEARLNLNDSDQDADLRSITSYYQGGDLLTMDEIAQLQSQIGNSLTNSQKLSWVEPLTPRYSLELHAERRAISENQDRSVYDDSTGLRIADLSSGFDRTYSYANGGMNVRFGREGLNASLGLDVQRSNLDGAITDTDVEITNGYTYLLPSASINYEIAQGRNISARYSSSTREPSMRDLQPFVDNSNPLNTYVGNPGLKPQYSHNLTLHYMLFDQFTFTNLFAFVRAGYTADAIVRSRTIDEQLRQTSTVVNSDGAWNVSGNVNFGTPIRPIGTKINLSNNLMFNRGFEFINGDENATNTVRNAAEVKLENRNKKYFDVAASARYTLNSNRYSLNPGLNQNYINSAYTADFAYTPTDYWSFSTSLEYRIFSGEVFGSAQNIPLWQAEISRTFLHEKGQLKLVAVDLLNKNVGVNYNNTGSYIEEERINSLGRYVMLKFIYNLRGIGKQKGMVVEMHG